MAQVPDCIDQQYAMTAEQHALLHISETQGRHAQRIEQLEKTVKAQARLIAQLMEMIPR